MDLSEDELKILINILNQLTFKLPDAIRVLPIVKKLEAGIKEPGLNATPVSVEAVTASDTVSK